MSAVLIAQLLATFGPSAIQLITQLIQLAETNTSITSAQWSTLIASLEKTPSNVAVDALKAAGVDTTTTKAQDIVKLTS